MIDYGSPGGEGPWGQGAVLRHVLGQSGNNMSMRWGIMPIYHVCHVTLPWKISVLFYNFTEKTENCWTNFEKKTTWITNGLSFSKRWSQYEIKKWSGMWVCLLRLLPPQTLFCLIKISIKRLIVIKGILARIYSLLGRSMCNTRLCGKN